MSLEESPTRTNSSASVAADGPDYWNGLIDETAAGAYLKLTKRTMQGLRQRGGGPNFIRVSSRCVRYRRIDLKAWADQRVRTSTSDPGQAVA